MNSTQTKHSAQNTEAQTANSYRALEERTLEFAKGVVRLCKAVKRDTVNIEVTKQLIRSAGSIGANYREANEALGKRDFVHRLRIARKEAKETSYWLDILQEAAAEHTSDIEKLRGEAVQLRNILSKIIEKSL